jgi:probable addiction module antidote protein
MAKVKTRPFDAANYLKSGRQMTMYLQLALDDGHPGMVADALGAIARARGMAGVAKKSGLGRESLYKALSATGNPELGTVLKVIRALGLELRVASR